MRKRLYIICALVVIASLTLITLNATVEHPNRKKNGFERKFLNTKAVKNSEVKSKDDLTEICGFRNDSIYLGTKTPGVFYCLGSDLKRYNKREFKVSYIHNLSSLFYTSVDYPSIYIVGGNARKAIMGNLLTSTYKVLDIPTGPFMNGTVINDHILFLKAIDTSNLNMSFKKINTITGKAEGDSALSENLHDAGFTHTGMLSYDESTGRLLFVDFYSNQITCFDTALHLIYTAKTIDTTNISNAHPGRKDNSITNAKPPVMVNLYSSVANNTLYVISGLDADNENKAAVEDNCVVDEYSVYDGKYLGSFYIPTTRRKEVKDFKVSKSQCAVLLKERLVKYTISINPNS